MIRTLTLALAALSLPAHAANTAQLESCYQAYGQIETTTAGGKKTTVYKDQAQVAAECNQKVIAEAKKSKKPAEILELAGVIGKNSNWQSAMPVYTLAAKADKKASCTGKDQMYALDLALAAPADDAVAKGGKDFMATCWPQVKKELETMLKTASGYNQTNLCSFLASKNAVPANKKAKCAAK